MLSLRRLDREGMQDYLEALRPRLVVFSLATPQLRLVWWMPLWALEQSASLLLRLLPLLPHLAPLLGREVGEMPGGSGGEAGSWDSVLASLLSEPWHDLLRLPPGEPFISIETADVRLEIRQL